MHGLVGGQRTESFGHIVWDFVENCSENVDRQDGSDRSGLKENVLHCLRIFCNTRVDERSRGRKINSPSNQKKLKHVIVELGFRFTGFIFTRFNNNGLRSLLDRHHLSSKLLHKAHRIKRLLIICRRLLRSSSISDDDGGGSSDVSGKSNTNDRRRDRASQGRTWLANRARIAFEKGSKFFLHFFPFILRKSENLDDRGVQ